MTAGVPDTLTAWIGRSESAEGVISQELVDRMAATFDSIAVPAGTIPLGAHWCVALIPSPMQGLGVDGHPAKGGLLPPVPFPRRMWAGGNLEFHDRFQIGDVARRVSIVTDIQYKSGRTGPLAFVTITHLWTTARGPAVTERQDLVYRSPQQETAPIAPRPTRGDHDATQIIMGVDAHRLTPDAAMLFRYSALTFNAHRIHYDRDYAVKVEGYSERVVQGPLQATALMNFASTISGPPSRFTFRSTRPAFVNRALTLAVTARDGPSLSLAAVDDVGSVCMQAEWTVAASRAGTP
ncbi:MAG: MaoC family dehydratase N-terminal domain-containing protein [Sphingomonadales bacterium]